MTPAAGARKGEVRPEAPTAGREAPAAGTSDVSVESDVGSPLLLTLPEDWLSELLRGGGRLPSGAGRGLFGGGIPSPSRSPERALLPEPYFTYGFLQATDVYTTHAALKGGAKEANPFLRSAARNPAVLIAVKTASTAGTIFLLEKLRRRNPKVATITIATLNVFYAAIVLHNRSVRTSGTADSRTN